MPEEEEVLGEEEATTTEDEGGGGGGGFDLGGLFDFSGGLLDSFVIKILVGAIAVVAVVLIVVFVTNWTLENIMMGTDPEAEAAEEEDVERDDVAAGPLETMALDEFILTRRDPRSGRINTFQIEMYLAFNPEGERALREELGQRRAQIRDKIYSILGARDVEELDYAYQDQIKDDLIVELNRLLQTRHRIQDIYFTEYVIQ